MLRFQIRDLEEFSGVRAHTIRMWEKRYGLLSPDRTDTNIRTYGIDELKAILNVAFLNQHGYKISRIAALNAVQREKLVRDVALGQSNGSDILNSLKMGMLSFDEVLFESVSSKYRDGHGFRALMEKVYIPLLEQIGILWQTSSICPAHEHFVSNLIRQKLIVAIDALPLDAASRDLIHILYLPENELHELGLLYMNYLLRAKGERTIYLGQSVPHHDLKHLVAMFSQRIVFITILTTNPPASEVPALLKEIRSELPHDRFSFWIAGNQMAKVPKMNYPNGMRLFGSMAELMEAVENG